MADRKMMQRAAARRLSMGTQEDTASGQLAGMKATGKIQTKGFRPGVGVTKQLRKGRAGFNNDRKRD
jgi:hypothetical protein